MRSEFLQVTRHGKQHRGSDLEQSGSEVFRIFAEMRHQLRHQRKRDGDIAAKHVAHRQVDHGAVYFFAQRRILRNDRVSRGEMLAVADQRALGMTGGAGGIDDESGILG